MKKQLTTQRLKASIRLFKRQKLAPDPGTFNKAEKHATKTEAYCAVRLDAYQEILDRIESRRF